MLRTLSALCLMISMVIVCLVIAGCGGGGSINSPADHHASWITDFAPLVHASGGTTPYSGDPYFWHENSAWFTVQGVAYEVRPMGGFSGTDAQWSFWKETASGDWEAISPIELGRDSETEDMQYRFNLGGKHLVRGVVQFDGKEYQTKPQIFWVGGPVDGRG